MLADEQVKSIKEQLIKQIESTFPEEKKAGTISYIQSMNNEQLEAFLIKNKLIKPEGSEEESKEDNKESKSIENSKNPSSVSKENTIPKEHQNCIMCLLSSKNMPSLQVYEDKDYLAVLEINPLSDGQILLIPKQHHPKAKALKSKAFTLANKIGKHLVKNLNATNYHVSSSDELHHAIINIIPEYKGQDMSKLQRKPADKKHLQEIAIKIGEIKSKTSKPRIKKAKEEKPKIDEKKVTPSIIKLPRRIP
jgi:histidine triad (HIT) family protein